MQVARVPFQLQWCNIWNLNSVYAQSLRWKIKPKWLPPAKTKVFKIPEPPKIPADEAEYTRKVWDTYSTQVESLL